MKITSGIFCYTLISILLSILHTAKAQSPDSRVCACLSSPVDNLFMKSSKMEWNGRTPSSLDGSDVTVPSTQQIKFTMPELPVKSGCYAAYTIYIETEAGQKVYESTGRTRQRLYQFSDCTKKYYVSLSATAKSGNVGQGNCTRHVRFKVTPQCATNTCACGNSAGKDPGITSFALTGEVVCLPPQNNQQRYVLKMNISNQTDCILDLTEIKVLNETVSVTPTHIAAKKQMNGISLGFNRAGNATTPSGSSTIITIRYRLNDKPCEGRMKIPLKPCQ